MAERLEITVELQYRIFDEIDAHPPLAGSGVGYRGSQSTMLWRPCTQRVQPATYVILEGTDVGPDLALPPEPPAQYESRLRNKVVDVGINCGGAVLAGLAASAGALAAPITGGASTIVTALTGAAAVAGAAQCGISIGQTAVEFIDPGANDRFLDNEDWFRAAGYFLDGVQLLGFAAGLGPTYKGIKQILSMQQSTKKSISEIIRGLNRQERKQLAKELAGYGKKLSGKQWKRLARAGAVPKAFSNSEIKAAIVEQLVNGIGNVLSLYGSSRSGNVGLLITIVQHDERDK